MPEVSKLVAELSAARALSKVEQAFNPAAHGCIGPLTTRFPRRAKPEDIEVFDACLFDEIDDAVGACVEAQKRFQYLSLQIRRKVIESIRLLTAEFSRDLAWCAWSETGRGRYEDKIAKQVVASLTTCGTEDLAPKTCTGDHGLTTTDYAPLGVVSAITPVANPTATVVNNAINLLSGGNAVVFHAHPAAQRSTNRAVAVINQAVVIAGGPPNVVVALRNPTIASSNGLMKHPLIAANLVTGDSELVQAALISGKRSICAGPANPPAVVDETADIAAAAQGIYRDASFDNGQNCSAVKEVFVVVSVVQQLMAELEKLGAFRLERDELERLMQVIMPDKSNGALNKELVGRDAALIASQAGIEVPGTCRLLVAEAPADHPLVAAEQQMPVLPVVTCPDFEKCVASAKKAEGGRRQSSSIYSQSINRVTAMASFMDTALFTINGAHSAGLGIGGEGYPSFSIACATGEGMTRPSTFVRERRLVCCNALRFV